MKIKVIESNKEKINATIKVAEGRAKERTIEYFDICIMVKAIEGKFNIPKKYMNGVVAEVDIHAGKLPISYKWRAASTHVLLENIKGAWYLVDVSRKDLRQNNRKYIINFPKATADKLLEKYLSF